MILVRRLVANDWQLWREVRLAALADAPYAYGSTLEREQAFDEATWRDRLSSASSMTAVAFDGTEPVGAIATFTHPRRQCPCWSPRGCTRRIALAASVPRW